MTSIIEVITINGGVQVKTDDGQSVFLMPGDNKIALDGYTANWHYDTKTQNVTVGDVAKETAKGAP